MTCTDKIHEVQFAQFDELCGSNSFSLFLRLDIPAIGYALDDASLIRDFSTSSVVGPSSNTVG